MIKAGGIGDLRTLANGLFPAGFDADALTPKGRDEVRAAIDVIIKLWDYNNAKLNLGLGQLDKAASEIERLRAALMEVVRCFDAAEAEGLGFQISSFHEPGSLVDLVIRRLLPARAAARAALSTSSARSKP